MSQKKTPSSYAANIRPHVDVGFRIQRREAYINTRETFSGSRVLRVRPRACVRATPPATTEVCVCTCAHALGNRGLPAARTGCRQRAASRVGHRAIESDRSHRAVGMTHCLLDGACGRPVPPRVQGARTISNAAASRARRWQLGQCRRASLQRCGEAANAAERRRLSVAHGERSWLLPQISCAGRASW